MQAGTLNQRIKLQSKQNVQDEAGQLSEAWVDVATLWANIRDISGREFLSADAAQNAAQTKITIRYRVGVAPAMRVVHGADIYNIHAVLGNDRVSLLLMCERLA